MQFPESWLREFCNPSLSTTQLAEVLTMGGLEVEELKPVAPPFTGIVVGQIMAAEQHPNADRLRVCQVNVGQAELLNIVCGAPNARVGIKIPCALVGAALPPGEDGKPFMIKLGKLRGVESQGMLCSANELKLNDSKDGLLELAADATIGQDIRTHLNLDDTLLTLKLTPNLAHCLSVYGVARELSALTGAPLKQPSFPPVGVSHQDKLAVKVSAPDLCGRFSGRIVKNVNAAAATPQWMVDRLARCGQRSVTALVDISNYVMFELGRPSHIFDLDKIHGGLDVRWGKPAETLKLLNGNVVTVDGSVGVIADDDAIESLAGIMGGDATAVSDATQNIYIEAAFWWPKTIAGRSRRFNFSTDAGHRFERGVDPQLTVEHIERITQLVLDICGGTAGPMDDLQVNMPIVNPVSLRVARAAKVIGMPINLAQCVNAFTKLGLPHTHDGEVISVTPPSYRFDLQIEEDLIEEVVRMVGYNQLPTTPPLAPITAKIRPESQRGPFAVRRALAAMGYQETINFSFVEERWEHELAGNPNPIRLLNPIASNMSVMRSSLLGSLLQVLKYNIDRKAARVRIFEVGRVFLRDASVKNTDTTVDGFHQPMRVAGLVYGHVDALQWGRTEQGADYFDVKGEVEALLAPIQATFEPATHPCMHPGRCARVRVDGREIGYLGELHPQWYQSYELSKNSKGTKSPILFELELDALLQRTVPVVQAVLKQQDVERDIAVLVSEKITHADVMQAIAAVPTQGLTRHAVLFDIYRPKTVGGDIAADEKSLAVRLTFNSVDATLNEETIDGAVQSVVSQLKTQLGARLRG
ncbi:MAG: phenylalanine--tRNA ligase subunit beta [Burkholderiaceae bacterium]|nr:phenylalanine--tRNA ligase subunit beta [Burkholderiaceae bacterium]